MNLITVICLLYGVIIRSYVHILPWIIVSLVTFSMALFTFLAAIHGRTVTSTDAGKFNFFFAFSFIFSNQMRP